MKKSWKLTVLLTLAALILLLPTSAVLADAKGTLKGTILSSDPDGGTFLLETKDGEVTVVVPEGFDFDAINGSMTVLVKGQWLNDTDFQAEWVKQVGKPDKSDEPDDEKEFKNDFCSDAKQENHPLAAKIVAKYGEKLEIDETTIMEWFCEGHSFGQIMLALTTHILDPESDPYELLLAREGGLGWGKIWKDKGLIGKERQGMPPGWVKKPDKAIPPGLLKKTPTP